MAKKKMCPYGSVSRGNGCSFIGRKHLLTKDEILKYCPKSTNSRCELIPSKKERVVKVKGRMFFTKKKYGPLCVDTCNIETTDKIEALFKKYGSIRCELTYKLPKGAK